MIYKFLKPQNFFKGILSTYKGTFKEMFVPENENEKYCYVEQSKDYGECPEFCNSGQQYFYYCKILRIEIWGCAPYLPKKNRQIGKLSIPDATNRKPDPLIEVAPADTALDVVQGAEPGDRQQFLPRWRTMNTM